MEENTTKQNLIHKYLDKELSKEEAIEFDKLLENQ
jgi:anti-sigma factor RsiW